MERDALLQTLEHIFTPLPYDEQDTTDLGFLEVVCLTISIDGQLSDQEISDALTILAQLHLFEEHDDQELRELLSQTLHKIHEQGLEGTLEAVKGHLTGDRSRELAFKMVAFLNESDGRVVPIESALLHGMANLFEYDGENTRALLDELYNELEDLNVESEEAPQEPQTAENNPFLAYTELPRFREVQARHLVPATTTLLAELEVALEELEASAAPTWEGVVEPLERLNARLAYLWRLAGHLLSVRNEPSMRAAYEEVQPALITFSMRVGQSRAIYDTLAKLEEDMSGLDEPQRRILASLVRDAEHSGVGLDGAARERFNEIQGGVAATQTQFSNNVLDSVKAFEVVIERKEDLEGLPTSMLELYAQSAVSAGHEGATAQEGPWRISLDAPSVFPFLRHGRNRELRQQLYLAYIQRASQGEHDNAGRIDEILTLRQEESALLGYEHFAALSLSAKMATDVGAVHGLLEELREVAYDAAHREHEDLTVFAHEHGFEPGASLEHWDLSYWSERQREELYEYNEEELRQYFPFPNVLHGLFQLIEDLFDVSIKESDEEVETWHNDVQYFQVFDNSGAICASFFLDPYSRPAEKRGGAWHSATWGRSKLLGVDGQTRQPVSYIVCNQTPPVDGKASLMRFSEVKTLFHEFGHGLQHMLTQVDYSMAAGISNIEWDAVELPSQFMENWCYQPDVLREMTSHVDTGESLPLDFVEKLLNARNYRAGSGMLRQVYYASIDMTLHSDYEPGSGETAFEVQRRVAEQTSVLPPHAQDRFLCSFQHIFVGGYSAGYYSYKWAEVLSADAFSAFEEAGLEDQDARAATGRRFRDTVLAKGGGQDPMEVFAEFRGRAPSTEPLLRHHGLLERAAE